LVKVGGLEESVVGLAVHREVGYKRTRDAREYENINVKNRFAIHNTTTRIKRKKWSMWRVKENSQLDWRFIARSAESRNTETHGRQTGQGEAHVKNRSQHIYTRRQENIMVRVGGLGESVDGLAVHREVGYEKKKKRHIRDRRGKETHT